MPFFFWYELVWGILKIHNMFTKLLNIIIICYIWGHLEKPSAFAPRGQATLTLTGKMGLTLCGKIRLPPECGCHSGAFL